MFVIIGASGYLGSYLIKNVIDNTDEKVIATYNSNISLVEISNSRVRWVKLDISDFLNVNNFCKQELGNDIKYKFIYLSSFIYPDEVEKNPKKAWNINVASLDYFLSKAKDKIHSLYYSSGDSIYGESVNDYIFNESDSYNPINTYGRTKAIAEQIVLMYGFSVIRYSLLMGPSLSSKKHFFDKIVESLKNKSNIDMFYDSRRSVIEFNSAACFTIKLLEERCYKKQDIINISSDTPLSKFEIALKIAKKLNLDSKYINSTSMVNQSCRARDILMSNQKLKGVLNLREIEFLN